MDTKTCFRKRAVHLAAAAVVALIAMCALLLPRAAFASDQVAHTFDPSSPETPIGFNSPDEAVSFGAEKSWPIYMDTDWDCSDLEVPEGKKLTIYMEGHTIANKTHVATFSIFYLYQDAELELKGDSKGNTHQITYDGYVGIYDKKEITTTTGGLLTSTNGAHVPLIRAKENNKVIIDGVTLGGAYSYDNKHTDTCGAINLGNESYLSMKNGASIEHNSSGQGSDRGKGAGIAANAHTQIDMDNASVHDNYSDNYGGGIYVDNTDFVLNMSNGSKIENNQAGAGGGIYLNRTNFTIKCNDHSASISNNSATKSNRASTKGEQSGGGIHVDSTTGSNEGLIEGITIANNYSAYDGGGLELDQRWTTVRNCEITGNSCKYEGGGIYDCNSDNLLDNCTVTGNVCNVGSGGNYEGGGVYVWCDYDLKLSNQCVIKGNTRGKNGNADDVFLRENTGATAKAYITGSLSAGSSVGIRSGIEGDRRVATNFKHDTNDCLFYDLDGYYVSYGTDEGGDAWQRHATREFLAQVNGEGSNRYKWNSPVTLVAPLAKDGKVFVRWDTGRTTGLNPIDDYIDGSQIFANALGFDMPQNDVNAVATYADKATALDISVGEPVAGMPLPSTAEFGCGGLTGSASVTWYEAASSESEISVASDIPGEAAAVSDATEGMTPVSGIAKEGTVYVASVTCFQSADDGLCFSDSITADDVTVNSEGAAAEASVDGCTGAITVVTEGFRTEGDTPAAETGKANVKAVTDGLALSSSEAAREELGSVEVSYAKGSGEVTFAAPVQSGYNFCCWEDVPDGWHKDDEVGVVTVPQSALDEGYEPTAVYTPVVTKIEFAADAPVTGGGGLASEVPSLWLTCSNGDRVDFAEVLRSKGLGVAWSPEGEDGKAGFSTAHTAVIELVDDAEGLVDVDKVVSTDVVAVAQNGVRAEAAGFAVMDGKLCLAVAFPATPDAKATGISQPADVELTLEEAKACAESGSWPLQRAVNVEVESGVAAEGDIAWDAVEGFDANATGAQELTVKGEVAHIDTADGNKVNTDNVSLNVACRIKIAAPAQDGGEDGGETPAVNPDEGDGQPAAGDAAAAAGAKSASAKTGDSTPVLAVAAVAVVAIAAVVVAIVAARRNRRR